MSNEPAETDGAINLPKITLEGIERERRFGIRAEQFKRDLLTNPRYKEFFSAYDPSDVTHFAEEYSWRKAMYLEHGEMYTEFDENDLIRFDTEGQEHLFNILKKKLHNLECLWRAEQIRIPEVEQTWDFMYWAEHLERCPFIPPITETEVDAYVDYLLSDQFEDEEINDWDEIRYLMETDEDGDLQYPEWYAFYDARFGTTMLFKLPDVRGEKEHFYRRLYFDAEHPELRESQNHSPEHEDLLRIGYLNLDFYEKFMIQFEDEKLLRYFRAIRDYDQRHDDEELQKAIEMLKCADEPVPIDAADNWREGIMKAADRFRREKLAEGVRTAYGNYLMRRESKLFLEQENVDEEMDTRRQTVREQIVKGRILNGEPPDLNF